LLVFALPPDETYHVVGTARASGHAASFRHAFSPNTTWLVYGPNGNASKAAGPKAGADGEKEQKEKPIYTFDVGQARVLYGLLALDQQPEPRDPPAHATRGVQPASGGGDEGSAAIVRTRCAHDQHW
jgi:hypothetical protein